MRYWNGNYMSATRQAPTVSSASGIFTLRPQQIYKKSNKWPVVYQIVASNLRVHLDAANYSSYSGSGSAWNDLSGNSEHFTLYNSPTFSSAYGGELIFTGSNDYARRVGSSGISAANSNGTVQFWFRTTSSSIGGGNYGRVISIADAGGTGSDTGSQRGGLNDYNQFFTITRRNTQEKLAAYYKNNPRLFGPSTLVDTDTYFNVAFSWSTTGSNMTFDFYLNAVNTNSTTTAQTGYSSSATSITLGQAARGALTSPSYNTHCAFSSFLLYDRALTAAEVTQNYNALKSRYGL